MKNELSPKQALYLWRMIAAQTADSREPTLSTARPELDAKKERTPLLDKGYLTSDKRGRSTHLVLTDKAWAWAGGCKEIELPSDPGSQALQGLLHRLLPFLQQREFPFASLFVNDGSLSNSPGSRFDETKAARKLPAKSRSTSKPLSSPATPSRKRRSTNARGGVNSKDNPADLMSRVEEVCLRLCNGQRKQRVRLATLRAELDDMSRREIDQALLELQDAGRAVLYRDDNTGTLTAADHDAALIVGNAPRHLVYLEA